jgi:hypothetical protein
MSTIKASGSGLETNASGYAIGRDPRMMSQAEIRAVGHDPMSPMQAIRAHCLDCCGGAPAEVRACAAVRCPSWPFRMGRNPWRQVTEARREAGRRLAARIKSGASDPSTDLGFDEEDDGDGSLDHHPEETGVAEAAELAVTSVTCEVCGQTFTPKRSDARICSAACRQRAHRRAIARALG